MRFFAVYQIFVRGFTYLLLCANFVSDLNIGSAVAKYCSWLQSSFIIYKILVIVSSIDAMYDMLVLNLLQRSQCCVAVSLLHALENIDYLRSMCYLQHNLSTNCSKK